MKGLWRRSTALSLLLAGLALAAYAGFSMIGTAVSSHALIILGIVPRNGFLQGAALTLFVTASAGILALVGASILAWLRSTGHMVPIVLVASIVSFGRGTPLLLQLFIFYFALPELGLVLSPLQAGIAALAYCYSAYGSEIIRSSMQAVPRNTLDAARALGLSKFKRFQTVHFPLAIRYAAVPMGNLVIALVKDTSLVSVIGVWDMMMIARIYGARDLSYLHMLVAVGIVYWIISALLEIGVDGLEQRLSRYPD
ncbi:amino acid ABC transporter permease [Zhengella mangrovi]|uniref:amino acid ABC transporter permease n=1 Tax=Zhengella mangrovi TaxID=1982044 RepID=UPI0013FD8C8B|nr:amino acid ABC transporter permease [Zhengella mangrovi]